MPIIRPRLPKLSDYAVSRSTVPTRGAFSASRHGLVTTVSNKGLHYSSLGAQKDAIYGIHFERHRGRIERKPTRWRVPVTRNEAGKFVGVPYRRVSEPYWIVSVYRFPADMVKTICQKARHFDVELNLTGERT